MLRKLRLTFLMAVLAFSVGFAPSAWAAIVDLGIPIAPHGYPAWYEDSTGLRLELCLPAPAGNASRPDLCVFDDLDEEAELIVTGESFWWLAEAEIDLPNDARARLTLGVEATFGADESAVNGNQIAFGRTRIRIDTPIAGTYIVTHPYATHTFDVVDPDEGINYTADIGASNFLNVAAGFRGTLNAPLGPYLTWPDYETNMALQVLELDGDGIPVPGPVVLEQYIGNPNVLSTVVGGTNGNIFRIEGPPGANLDGLGSNVVETDLFSVMGKVFDETVELVAHEFPGEPPQNLFAVGPVNRPAYFIVPAPLAPLVDVTGVDYDYAVGYPLWYQENIGTPEEPVGGLQLTLCTPGDPMCLSDPIDPTDLTQTTMRTGGEGFWWIAEASFDVGEDEYELTLAIESTFGGDESITDGNQITFGRERIRFDFDNDTPVATYRVTHPYGVRILEGDPDRLDRIRMTSDIGIADPADPDSAMIGTLYSAIGPTFLTWTTFNRENPLDQPDFRLVTPNAANPDLSNIYVGNPNTPHPVTGSPFNTNYFRVERLVSGSVENGNWQLVGETNLFAVSGKVFDPATFEFSLDPATPVALPDAATLNMVNADSITINVAGNDIYTAGLTVTIELDTTPADGTAVANNPAGTITYTPDADFAFDGGIDTFSYRISQTFLDGTTLTSAPATVTVTVIPIETISAPRARFNTLNLSLDLRGTSNFRGSTLTIYAGTSATGTPLGMVVVDDDGRWRFRGTITSNLTNITIVNHTTGETLTQPIQVR